MFPGARIAALTMSALIATLLPASGAQASAVCGGSMATTVRTFHVVAKPKKKSYPLNGVAVVDVTVTRPAHEDPLGEGNEVEPPASAPAEDVNVSVGIYLGDYYMYDVAVTDEDGHAMVKVKLNRNAPAGWSRAEVAARTFYNRGGCPDIEEEGYATYDRFFKGTK